MTAAERTAATARIERAIADASYAQLIALVRWLWLGLMERIATNESAEEWARKAENVVRRAG